MIITLERVKKKSEKQMEKTRRDEVWGTNKDWRQRRDQGDEEGRKDRSGEQNKIK